MEQPENKVLSLKTPKTPKAVRFNTDLNKVFSTYSPDEYDRHTIDYAIKRRLQNKMSIEEWKDTLSSLERYKTNVMVVHSSNVCSIHLLGLHS
jgi:hypothetical protein